MCVLEKLIQDGSFRKRLKSLQLKTCAIWPSTDAVIICWMKQEMLLQLRRFFKAPAICVTINKLKR
jgi:hypothetical protein